jgi:hypothetical protein
VLGACHLCRHDHHHDNDDSATFLQVSEMFVL